MQFHRSTLAAFAATCLLTLFAAEGSGASADNGNPRAAVAPSLTDEIVPQTPPVEFIAREVAQPLPDAAEAKAGDADTPRAHSLAAMVEAMPRDGALSRELDCLAGAVYFEARGEPLAGQLAVAQVVINRSESGRYPADYCGVVFQRAQFSFVRGGRMPAIDRGSEAWHRASAIARIAHRDLWDSPAGDALFFHARYVKPSWSRTKIARATIDSHIFYR
jgi:spore germination cell wall hydrolase CwlJ-like protein